MKLTSILSVVVVIFLSVIFANEEKCYDDSNPEAQEAKERGQACDPDTGNTSDVVKMNKALIKCFLKPDHIVDENDQLDVEKYKQKEASFIANESKRSAIMAALDSCANGTNIVDICPND